MNLRLVSLEVGSILNIESFDSAYNTHALLLIPRTAKASPAAMAKPQATAAQPPRASVFATRPIEVKEVWA